MAEGMIDVKYTSNGDPRDATGAVSLEGRPTLYMGHIGQVTPEEYATVTARGVVLEVLSETDVKKELKTPTDHTHGSLAHAHASDFESMTQSDLEALADAHQMVVEGSGSGGRPTKKDLEGALTTAHA